MKSKNDSRPTRRRVLTREQLIAQLESEIEGVARMKLARRMAPEFIRYYEIFPYGVNLVRWLTHHRCHTNLEAMVDWIEAQLDDPGFLDEAVESDLSIALAYRLQRLLARVEDSHPW
jgi:hypothetical protein